MKQREPGQLWRTHSGNLYLTLGSYMDRDRLGRPDSRRKVWRVHILDTAEPNETSVCGSFEWTEDLMAEDVLLAEAQ